MEIKINMKQGMKNIFLTYLGIYVDTGTPCEF